MDSRNPFSKRFKKLKHKLAGGGRKRDGSSGSGTDRGRETVVEGSEASQRNFRPHPEVEDVESGPSREEDDVGGDGVGQVGPPTLAPSTSHCGESGGTTPSELSQPLPVPVSLDNTDKPPTLDRSRELAKLPTHALDPGDTPEDTSGRNPTTSTALNITLREVEESTGAYLPLESILGCLCVVLDNCEVCLPPAHQIYDPHSYTSKRGWINKPSNGWCPASEYFFHHSVHLFLRMMSMRERGKISWNGEVTFSNVESPA
jgi:hypothetical protein